MGKKKRKKLSFGQQWGSMTQIGKNLGLSAIKVGALLKEWGYRDDNGHPTPQSLAAGLARSTPTREGFKHFMWDRAAVAGIFKSHGVKSKVSPSDAYHGVVMEICDLIRTGAKAEEKGLEKLAIANYESAIELFQATLAPKKEDKQLNVAVHIHHQLDALLGEKAAGKFLHQGYSISWEQVQAQREAQKLKQAVGSPDPVLPRSASPRI